MSLKTRCPDCGLAHQVSENLQGKKIRCKKCGRAFPVRAASSEPGDGAAVARGGAAGSRRSEATRPTKPSRSRPEEDEDEGGERPRRRHKGRGQAAVPGLVIGLAVAGVVVLLGVVALGARYLTGGRATGGKTANVLPVLDRRLFIEETGINLPPEAEILNSQNLDEGDGFTYTCVILRMPKSAEDLLAYASSANQPGTLIHQVFVRKVAGRAGYKLKNPNLPVKLHIFPTKTRGTWSASSMEDGDWIIVTCDCRTKNE